jgi:hypothetical protein
MSPDLGQPLASACCMMAAQTQITRAYHDTTGHPSTPPHLPTHPPHGARVSRTNRTRSAQKAHAEPLDPVQYEHKCQYRNVERSPHEI